ncbi:MAG TPA: lysophospholipid acyltransferase family protein [Planctomycetota bacterium]|jgi:KDO2-lipid IV(A) lauroyltransferase|nr:lysophospholipid acyltransferase family protein [Planctomycetota bacterium]
MSRAEKFRLHEVRPVQFILYVMLRFVVMAVGMFPWRAAPSIARVLGFLIRTIDRKHVRIATKNLEKSRGVCPSDQIPAFIGRTYEHVALGVIEMMMLPRLMKRQAVSRYVKLVRYDTFDRVLKEGHGCIVVIGHLGNWEIGGLATNLAGYPLQSLARPIDNPWIDRYLKRFRTQTGQKMIPRDRALGEMIRVLQRGGMLVVQVDQDARQVGVYVNFFGRPASTHRAPATLSLKYNTPIVLVNTYREGALNYAVCSDPIYPAAFRDHPDPVKALTQAYSDRFEECVRQHPEQWFWMHDRWKTAERVARTTSEALV